MGITQALSDAFPSVNINGRRYHYGREYEYGMYLVENEEFASDRWSFETAEDLRAFISNLPESADRQWVVRRHPDWHSVTDAQREVYQAEHRAFLRELMLEKLTDGRTSWIPNVFRYDDDANYGYSVYKDFRRDPSDCDDVELRPSTSKDADGKAIEVLELHERSYEQKHKVFTLTKAQALKLASALITMATYPGYNRAATEPGNTTVIGE